MPVARACADYVHLNFSIHKQPQVPQFERIMHTALRRARSLARNGISSSMMSVLGLRAFAELFIAHLLGRTIRAESDLVDQLFNSSEKRLARLLLLPGELWQG